MRMERIDPLVQAIKRQSMRRQHQRIGEGARDVADMDEVAALLAVLAFAYDSRTVGNVATEIVKYFLQMHYHVKVDLREAWLLQRDNFYGQ